jgi:hypothetical protein
MGKTLAIMFTMTTYGTWLRGDKRGWVDKGIVLPPNPDLENYDRQRLKHPVFLFDRDKLMDVGSYIGKSLYDRMHLRILALTAQTWHVHFIIVATEHPISVIVKCAKDAVRWGLRPSQPIWSADYDKRFCFDEETVHQRIEYVERHNIQIGFPAKPWDFIENL